MNNEDLLYREMRRHHLRLTKTRCAVAGVFLNVDTPLSAPQILAALAKKSLTVNKTTVYRELERLEKIGLVRGVWFQDRRRYYELAYQGHHHHFVCTLCDTITDMEINEASIVAMAERLGQKTGFFVASHVIEFYGQCASCMKAFLSRQSV